MVYKCAEDGVSYYWKKGEIVGCARSANGVPAEEFNLLDAPETTRQIKIIETMVFNVLPFSTVLGSINDY